MSTVQEIERAIELLPEKRLFSSRIGFPQEFRRDEEISPP